MFVIGTDEAKDEGILPCFWGINKKCQQAGFLQLFNQTHIKQDRNPLFDI